MDCNESQPLIEAEVDGELGLTEHLTLQAHLRSCPACARGWAYACDRRRALRENLQPIVASPRLRERIRGSLTLTPAAAAVSSHRNSPFWPALGLVASFAAVALLGFTWGNARSHLTGLVSEAVSDHVRSLQASHLTDVTSTDQHTVKPWFAGQLDFSPPVVDLVNVGFPLVGGRLERIDGRAAAALVFRRRKHVINLFIWPATTAIETAHRSTNGGYFAETWSRAGLNFLAISEISASELAQFSELFRSRAP